MVLAVQTRIIPTAIINWLVALTIFKNISQLSCVQNSFWSAERELKAYVGAYVRLRFPRFCIRHNNFKELAYTSLTANFPGKPKSDFFSEKHVLGRCIFPHLPGEGC